MSTVTFTGPIKAGDVLNTTGTTAGSVKNVGFVEMSQQVAIAQSATAAATTICIPANSTIIAIDVLVTAAWSSATTTYTLSVGTSATATELVAATNANAVGKLALTPGTDATKTALWANTGTSDSIIYVLSGAPSATPGTGTLVVRYIQAANV